MTVANTDGVLFFKALDLLKLSPRLFHSPPSADITLRDIEICEMFRRDPHPSLCYYRGVTVNKQGLVAGVVFNRYDCTLLNLVHARQDGVEYLQALGYINQLTT
jgi:hypothetical protein